MIRATDVSVTWAQALAWRMERQLLDPVGSESVARVVSRLGAVLSMDESLAELAVRTRCTTSRPGQLAKALAEGKVIKAFAFRGSMHYLSPEDGGIYLALRSAGRQWELPSWVDYYRLTPAEWPDFRAAVRDALSDGPLTVVELGDVLTKSRIYRHLKPVFDEGAGTLIKPLTWQGDMSLGPPRDGQHTFQRLDTNPRWHGIPNVDDAGPRAILAYLRTYGPATLDHVHYWLGNGLSAGRKRLNNWFIGLGDRLVAVDVEGTAAYVVREDLDALATASPSEAVRFLPGHDQFVDVVIHSYRFDFGLAPGDPALDALERRLATALDITVPAVTLDGAHDPLKPGGTAHLSHHFTGRHEHRIVDAGHALPHEAPRTFADAVLTVHSWVEQDSRVGKAADPR